MASDDVSVDSSISGGPNAVLDALTEHILSKMAKGGAVSGEFVSREEFFKAVHRMMTVEDHKAEREEQRKVLRDFKLNMQRLGDENTKALHDLRRLE